MGLQRSAAWACWWCCGRSWPCSGGLFRQNQAPFQAISSTLDRCGCHSIGYMHFYTGIMVPWSETFHSPFSVLMKELIWPRTCVRGAWEASSSSSTSRLRGSQPHSLIGTYGASMHDVATPSTIRRGRLSHFYWLYVFGYQVLTSLHECDLILYRHYGLWSRCQAPRRTSTSLHVKWPSTRLMDFIPSVWPPTYPVSRTCCRTTSHACGALNCTLSPRRCWVFRNIELLTAFQSFGRLPQQLTAGEWHCEEGPASTSRSCRQSGGVGAATGAFHSILRTDDGIPTTGRPPSPMGVGVWLARAGVTECAFHPVLVTGLGIPTFGHPPKFGATICAFHSILWMDEGIPTFGWLHSVALRPPAMPLEWRNNPSRQQGP